MAELVNKEVFRLNILPYLTVIKNNLNQDLDMDEPISTISISGSTINIDSRASTSAGVTSGGTVGEHKYTFTQEVLKPDLVSTGVLANISLGAKSGFSGGVYSKTATSNNWDSCIRGTDILTSLEGFAVSCAIINLTGTVRQMFGLDDNPSSNNSYSSIDFAFYQVNNKFYSSVYEGGKGVNTYAGNITINGDSRVGIEVLNGVATYFIHNTTNGSIKHVYSSIRELKSTYLIKFAFNRGTGALGTSKTSGIRIHDLVSSPQSLTISGKSTDLVSEEDRINLLAYMGLSVTSTSVYSNIFFTRVDLNKFKTAGTFNNIDLLHNYYGLASQDVKII
jgi:hypothetical protein